MQNRAIERRCLAAWRARACAAALAAGTSIYALGAGVGIPLAGNAAWLGVLLALPVVSLFAAAAPGMLRRKMARPLRLLFAFLLLADAAMLLAALSALVSRTLLVRARVASCFLYGVMAAGVCAAFGETGVSRMAFALRRGLPVLLLALGLRAVWADGVGNAFPMLGYGVPRIGLCALACAGGCVPVLLLLLPPKENPPEAEIPGKGFFALYMALGTGVGAVLLLFLTLSTGYESLAVMAHWGERLRIAGTREPNENIGSTALYLLGCAAMALSAAACLCGAWRFAMKKD